MNAWERIAELPIEIESYELTGHDREFGEFTRPSTVVHLHGDGQEGIGEDVAYDELEHIAHRDAGPVLDLKLRQSGVALWEVVERDPAPLRFICSTRLGGFGEDAPKSNTDPIRKRLAKYPKLEFKLDPENDWDADLIAEIAELAPVRVLDLKGLYRGTPVDVETDPELYRAVAEAFPDAYLEDPDLSVDAARDVLEPHADRVTWDAALHSLADVQEMARKAINSKPSRFGSLQELLAIYDHCERNGIAVYSGGQGELECGRGQIQYLASLFHASAPNDCAPSGFNDPSVPSGMPTSPMDPAPSETGFRWGER